MLRSQTINLRISEVRQRLNALAGQDSLTDEERAESDRLTTEFADCETRHRAAIVGESAEATTRAAEFSTDGEATELRQLAEKASIGRYLTHARTGAQLADGPELELNQALKVGVTDGIAIPWQALEVRALETRAPTTTAALDGGTMQRPILQRLFGMDVFDALGVRIDTVPAGMSEWPLLTGGVAPIQTAETSAAPAAVTAVFAAQSLKPKRLTGRYEFTYEQAAQVRDIEQALRRDLADAVRSGMNAQLFTGDGSGQNITGFLTRLTAPTDPTAEAGYSDYAKSAASLVDGIHAGMESQVSCVIGTESYQHAAGVFQTGSGEAGIEAIKKRSRMCMASNFVPAAASDIQNGNIYHAGMDAMRGDSIAAIWPTLQVIRDIYTNAADGQVNLTWITLWDCYTAFRPNAYKRVAFQLAP